MYYVVENLEQLLFYSKKYDDSVLFLSSVCSLSLGALYWLESVNIVRKKTDKIVDFIFNCGDNIGAVRMAKQVKLKKVIYIGNKDIFYLEDSTFKILTNEMIN